MTAPAPSISTEAPAPEKTTDAPFGQPMDFLALVELSDWQNVVSTQQWPEVWLHDRDATDYVALRDGKSVYLVSVVDTPEDGNIRDIARESLRRLAYGFGLWEAFEIVERAQRDAERAGSMSPRPSGDDGLEKGFTKPGAGTSPDVISARKARMNAAAERDRERWNAVAGEGRKP